MTAIVIDNGSHSIKGGFAGSFEPDITFPSKIARKTFDDSHIQLYAGNDVAKQVLKATTFDSRKSKLQVSDPLLDHKDVDWEGLQRLWKYLTYDKLGLDKMRRGVVNANNGTMIPLSTNYDHDFNLLVSHHPTDTLKFKSKLLECGYETFNADGVYIAPTTTLGLYSVGKLTGTVIDSGYSNTFVSSIYEGYMLENNVALSKIGGQTIDKFLQLLIKSNPRHGIENNEEGVSLSDCEKIKQKFCYCAQDFYEEEQVYNSNHNAGFNANNYQLPDGNMLSIRNEKYQSCELMFQPKIANIIGEDGAPQLIYQSISKCNTNLQKELYENIVCIGGNTLITGFVSRLHNGLSNFAPASVKINIKAPPERNYATFSGASILASQTEQMKDVWVSKKLYDEMGQQSVIVRCF